MWIISTLLALLLQLAEFVLLLGWALIRGLARLLGLSDWKRGSTGEEYEVFAAKYLERQGFRIVEHTGRTGDLGVDLVLCGHDHVYAQTFPINGDGAPISDYKYETDENGIKYAIDPQGPIHLESGCAGNQDRGIEDCLTDEERAKFEKISRMTYGTVAYSAIRIKENTLNVCYRKVSVNDGECFEENRFGIKKTSL